MKTIESISRAQLKLWT